MIKLLSQIVEHAAKRAPSSEAFRCRQDSIAYRELDSRTSHLASLLQQHGLQPGNRVAIYMPKCIEMAISVHGCLKAGTVYVPVDPALPQQRLQHVLNDAGVSAILTSSRQEKQLRSVLPDLVVQPQLIVGVDPDTEYNTHPIPWNNIDGTVSNQAVDISESDPAYIIYTSGSTGHPKGIVHTHRSGMAYAAQSSATYDVRSNDRLANFAPLHFDQSTFEYLAGPLAGATTVLIPEEHMRFPASLAKLIDDEQLTIWYSVPFALVQLLLRGALETRTLSSLRWVLYGGEPFPVNHLRKLMQQLPKAQFSNVYGPAEVNQCTYFHLSTPPSLQQTNIPIGTVWDAAHGLVVDEDDSPVNQGQIGELLVSTPTMMQCYWNQPERTAKSICERTVGGISRTYFRTGDLVRENEEGNLEFHGRRDRQVKIRGNRVELDEVEAVLLRVRGVQNAAAFTVQDEFSSSRTIATAFVQSTTGPTIEPDDLLQAVRAALPAYAVPSHIEMVDSFPQTTSGKTDYRALEAQWNAPKSSLNNSVTS